MSSRRSLRQCGWVWSLVVWLGCGGSDVSPTDQASGGAAGSSGNAGSTYEAGGGGAGAEGNPTLGGAAGSDAGAGGSTGTGGIAEAGGTMGCSTAECEAFKTPPGSPSTPPSPKEDASNPDGATELRHGLSILRMGEKNASGENDSEAWRELGFDIDGWTSTPKQTYHCKPRPGGKAINTQDDGKGGIDNSFGRNIVNPILKTFFDDLSGRATMSLQLGAATTVLTLGKIGGKPSYKGLLGGSLPAEGERNANNLFIKPPASDWSQYTWHPFNESVKQDGTPVVELSGAYLSDQVWVSGDPVVLRLQLAFEAGFVVPIQVYQARVKVNISDRAHGIDGIVGGILATSELTETFKNLAGFMNTQFCGGSMFLDGLILEVGRASDILLDGTQDPTKECDGISIGLGFESRATRIGSPVASVPPPDPCVP